MGFWDTMASRDFLVCMERIATSLEIIAEHIKAEEENKDKE